MRILLIYISIPFLLLACKDGQLEENDEYDQTAQTEIQESEFTQSQGTAILNKKVPSELFINYDVKLVLPFYYNRINTYEDEVMEEKWLWDRFSQNQFDDLIGTEISFDSYLNAVMYLSEEAVLIPFENDAMISIAGIKEDYLSEDEEIIYEDENSIIYKFSTREIIIQYFNYNPVSKTYLLYRTHFRYEDDWSEEKNMELAFELLRNAKNLQNFSSLENDFSSYSWPDYAEAQPKVLTDEFIDRFNSLKKQINIFMDPGERISVPNDGSHTYLDILRATTDEDFQIVKFLQDIEKGDQDKILESGNALENNPSNFFGILFNREQTSITAEKKGSAQIITLRYVNMDKSIETEYYVIGNLVKDLDSFYFKSSVLIKARAYYYASLMDYYIKNGTLQIPKND